MTFEDFVEREALALKSDGCTLVSELFQWCCYMHDLCYRTHKDPEDAYHLAEQGCGNFWELAKPITKSEADARFRRCIQSRSKLGKASPVAWFRWVGVKIGARRAWNNGGK